MDESTITNELHGQGKVARRWAAVRSPAAERRPTFPLACSSGGGASHAPIDDLDTPDRVAVSSGLGGELAGLARAPRNRRLRRAQLAHHLGPQAKRALEGAIA